MSGQTSKVMIPVILVAFSGGIILDSTEIVMQRQHVEVPPTSLKRWKKISAEQLPLAA